MQCGGERKRDAVLCLRQIEGHPVRRNELVTVGVDLYEQIMMPDRRPDRQAV